MASEAKDADLLASRDQGEVLQATVEDLQAEIAKLETRQYPPSQKRFFVELQPRDNSWANI